MRLNIIKYFILLAALVVGRVYAADNSIIKNFEFSGAGGVSWLSTENTHLVISPVETDSDRISSTSVGGTWKLGLGYYLFEQQLHQRDLFNHLLLELNVYGASNTVKGEVWQYELPQFYNYNFKAPISSTLLMLDFKPSLLTWNKLTPNLILGIGATWNTASYDETTQAGITPARPLSLSDNTEIQLAWDLGAGLSYALTDQLSFTAEYVYAFLGEATPKNNAGLIETPIFSYQIQSLLFGLSLKL